jgi:hypothetical protein
MPKLREAADDDAVRCTVEQAGRTVRLAERSLAAVDEPLGE